MMQLLPLMAVPPVAVPAMYAEMGWVLHGTPPPACQTTLAGATVSVTHWLVGALAVVW